jgi:superfamily I DNA and/or RNA helicase
MTPYNNQRNLLNTHLRDEKKQFEIMTVHKSQGQEWDTVILSVVDTHDKFFVDTEESDSIGLYLINTAISRAKKRLVIVCDKDYWINLFERQLLADLLKCGTEITA